VFGINIIAILRLWFRTLRGIRRPLAGGCDKVIQQTVVYVSNSDRSNTGWLRRESLAAV